MTDFRFLMADFTISAASSVSSAASCEKRSALSV